MKHFAIVVKDNDISEKGYEFLVKSSKSVDNKFTIEKFDAATPENVERLMFESDVTWNYPWEGEVIDIASGMKKRAYQTKNRYARMAAAMSHFQLWQACFEKQEPFMILEHDAMFMLRCDVDITKTKFNILGINNPLMATRLAQKYYDLVVGNFDQYQPVPYIDNDITVPQGLAGNSAYIISPAGAEQMISLVYNYGLWPNDALMCKQLVNKLGVTRKFYTRVQGLRSTTTQ